MIHPHTELKYMTPEIGYGVFARRPIPRGTITWVLDPLDRILTPGEIGALPPAVAPLLERYSWIDGKGNRILCWDFSRLMNHSCEANTFCPGGQSFEIAVRDISAGEELTCDYATMNLERPFVCACGSSACRGTVTHADFNDLAPDWDGLIRRALPDVVRVDQPLWSWLASPHALSAAAAAPEMAPSIIMNRFDGLSRSLQPRREKKEVGYIT
jgi:hypothetical protein